MLTRFYGDAFDEIADILTTIDGGFEIIVHYHGAGKRFNAVDDVIETGYQRVNILAVDRRNKEAYSPDIKSVLTRTAPR